jgi:hypothetical protein
MGRTLVSFMNPDDRWTVSRKNIQSSPNLATLRECLDRGPIIVEHRFYNGARAPDRLIFEDFEDVEAYLQQKAGPGDSFWVWDFDAVCRVDNSLVTGKKPDAEGRVPEGGAY